MKCKIFDVILLYRTAENKKYHNQSNAAILNISTVSAVLKFCTKALWFMGVYTIEYVIVFS